MIARVALAVCAAFVLLVASRATAAEPAPALTRFVGSYALAGTREQAQATVDAAFDQALASMNTVMRLVVKKAVASAFIETIAIALPGDAVSIKLGENPAQPAALDTPTPVERDGRSGTLTLRMRGAALEVLIEGEDGSVRNVLELSADGKTLQRSVTVTSKRLSKPVQYKLSYARR